VLTKLGLSGRSASEEEEEEEEEEEQDAPESNDRPFRSFGRSLFWPSFEVPVVIYAGISYVRDLRGARGYFCRNANKDGE
jgi:hypothetical protein